MGDGYFILEKVNKHRLNLVMRVNSSSDKVRSCGYHVLSPSQMWGDEKGTSTLFLSQCPQPLSNKEKSSRLCMYYSTHRVMTTFWQSHKHYTRVTIGNHNPVPTYTAKRNGNKCTHKTLYTNVCSTITDNSPNWKQLECPLINKKKKNNKKISYIIWQWKKGSTYMCYNMNETWKC